MAVAMRPGSISPTSDSALAMKHFLWMHPWDLEGWQPEDLLDDLAAAGIDEIRLAMAYHGGRLLLPRNRRYLVYEQHDSAVYFRPNPSLYGRVQPEAGPHIDATANFLRAAARRSFPVRAWLVLCHNDLLGRRFPDLAIRNYRGEPYSYTLCPAQPDVQEFIVALIRDVARIEGVTGLDLEALSFMGYEHNSLHDKRAVEPAPQLNVCHCSVCGGRAERIAPLIHILDAIREVTSLPVDLRYTDDPHFHGGKTYLPPEALPGRVATVTRTWFGKAVESMLPSPPLPVPAHGGFQFHPPDTRSAAALRQRYAHAQSAHGVGFYCYGLASEEHWSWLKGVLAR